MGGRAAANRPKWIAWSAWTMALGACIVPMSHFVTDKYYVGSRGNSSKISLCNDGGSSPGLMVDSDEVCNTSDEPVMVALTCLIPGMLLIGAGSTAMFTLGTTYIEDYVRKSESPLLLGMIIMLITLMWVEDPILFTW